MRLAPPALLLLAAACHKPTAPSCHLRVQAMAAHLAAPRPVAEIRWTASPALAAQLDDIAAEQDPARRASAVEKTISDGVRDCPEAANVFAGLSAEGGCRFAASCSHLMADFRRVMQPPVLQPHAATSARD